MVCTDIVYTDTHQSQRMSSIIIAVANQKGGVGKTTSTVNLARALVEAGKRVLVVDCDPQSSLSIVTGIDPEELRRIDEQGKTLYYSLVKGAPLADIVIAGSPALIPASIRLANAETEMVSPFGVAAILKKRLEPLLHDFDVVLIDCPPTLSLLTVNALTAAHAVVIPCKTDYLSMMGIPLLIESIDNVRRHANPQLAIIGIIPTLFNSRAAHDTKVLAELQEAVAHKGIEVFQPVNRATAFDKANAEGKAALELFPDTPGVEQYRLVARRILEVRHGQ